MDNNTRVKTNSGVYFQPAFWIRSTIRAMERVKGK
jgi:hypothetical protein